jgi:hypothetical protein
MNVYRSSTTMQMDAKYKAVKQSRCMTRVITALRSPINKTVSSRCDPKPGSLTGNAVQFSVGRQHGNYPSEISAKSAARSRLSRTNPAVQAGLLAGQRYKDITIRFFGPGRERLRGSVEGVASLQKPRGPPSVVALLCKPC